MERVPIPVAIAILLDRGRVFMIRRARGRPLAGQWEFPGGKVEVGESPESAVRRELREELGLRLGRVRVFGAYAHVYRLSRGSVHYVLLAYRAEVRPGPWDRSGRWVSMSAAVRRTTVAGSRRILDELASVGLVRAARRQP